jgi:hypothetical protein
MFYFWAICLGFIFVTGLLQEVIPLFIFRRSNHQGFKRNIQGWYIMPLSAKKLVVLQFTVSVTLIICTYSSLPTGEVCGKIGRVGYTRKFNNG